MWGIARTSTLLVASDVVSGRGLPRAAWHVRVAATSRKFKALKSKLNIDAILAPSKLKDGARVWVPHTVSCRFSGAALYIRCGPIPRRDRCVKVNESHVAIYNLQLRNMVTMIFPCPKSTMGQNPSLIRRELHKSVFWEAWISYAGNLCRSREWLWWSLGILIHLESGFSCTMILVFKHTV